MPDPPRSTRASGYWLLRLDGAVFTHGALGFFGAATAEGLRGATFRGIVATAAADGYWIVEDQGRIHSFGGAGPVVPLDGPVAAVAPVAGGAWVVSQHGTVVALGEAPAPPAAGIDAPVVGVAVGGDGAGWVLRRDGHVDALGEAPLLGSPAELGAGAVDFVGIAPTRTGHGYWVCGRNGELFGFGDATFEGSPTADGASVADVVGIDATLPGGYVLVTARGNLLPFGAIDLGPWQEVAWIPDASASIVDVALVPAPDPGPANP